jgi:hypothetical protein
LRVRLQLLRHYLASAHLELLRMRRRVRRRKLRRRMRLRLLRPYLASAHPQLLRMRMRLRLRLQVSQLKKTPVRAFFLY